MILKSGMEQSQSSHEKDEEDEKKNDYSSLDSGWGWLICLSCFIGNLTNAAVTYSFGILLQPLKEYFDEGTGLIAFVGSVNMAVIAITTPLAAIAIKLTGLREVYFVGSILSALSIFIAPYSPNTFVLMLTFSILNGIGLCLNGLVATVGCNYYFEKRLALATGINKTGLSIGSFIFPPLSSYVLQVYTWKGVMYLNAGIALFSSLFACLFIPFKSSKHNLKVKETESLEQIDDEKLLPYISTNEELDKDIDTNDPRLNRKSPKTLIWFKTISSSLWSSLDLTLWKNPAFLLLTACFTLINFGWTVYFMFTPSMLIDSQNMTSTEASLILTSTGVTNTICGVIA